jgi:hypothetical protein
MTLSLSGNWRYRAEDNPEFAQPGFDDSAWETMRIPQNWFLGGLDHHGVVWFRYEFQHLETEKFFALHFDGVDYLAEVYLNGQRLGSHTGYFEPFAFDATTALCPGRNVLAVRVDSPFEAPGPDGWHIRKRLIKGVLNHHDCRPGGGWDTTGQAYNTGGIWNRVHLEEHSAVTIEHLLLSADLGAHPPYLHAELRVKNRGRDRSARIEIQLTPENFKGKQQSFDLTVDMPAGESLHKVKMPVEDVHVWQPWDRGLPYLYNVAATMDALKDSASRSSLFGFRTVKVEEGYHWTVNGRPYFVRGSNYIPSQWLSETLFPEVAASKEHPFGGGAGGDFYTRDVSLARQANLNILRVHAHMLPCEFHEACDRAGMLVWQDFPLQWGYSDEPEFCAEAEREMGAMVTMLYNHPSIAAWCCHNESPWDAPWMAGTVGGTYDPAQNRDLDARLEAIARELDPARYIHRNSGTGDGHVYPGWYSSHWRDFQEAPGAPFVTEFGAQGLPVRENVLKMLPQFKLEAGYAELKRFKEWIDSYKKIKGSAKFFIKFGTALWNYTEKRPALKGMHEQLSGWVMTEGKKMDRSIYKTLPSQEETPEELRPAREVWDAWCFHDFQPQETFDNGIQPGASLDEFIANSQAYQSHLIQYATEAFRRKKNTRVTGIFQFDFTDPWPAITWSVLDYWRAPKPAYDALRRAMQPVLPTFNIPVTIEAGKAALVTFCVVNDLLEDFPRLTCEWRYRSKIHQIASATFPVSVQANGVSAEVKLTLPSVGAGKHRLSVTLVTPTGKIVGENFYDLIITPTE